MIDRLYVVVYRDITEDEKEDVDWQNDQEFYYWMQKSNSGVRLLSWLDTEPTPQFVIDEDLTVMTPEDLKTFTLSKEPT